MQKKYDILQIKAIDIINHDSQHTFCYSFLRREMEKAFLRSDELPIEAKVIAQTDNALFRQLLLEKGDGVDDQQSLFRSIIFIDFKNATGDSLFTKKTDDKIISFFKNGFSIQFEDKTVKFVNFEKSNSMSKDCLLSFIDESLQKGISERLSLGIDYDNQNFVLSKLYAYKGLMLSGGVLVGSADELGLNNESVVIVKDLEKQTSPQTIITAVNEDVFMNMLNQCLHADTDATAFHNDLEILTTYFTAFDLWRSISPDHTGDTLQQKLLSLLNQFREQCKSNDTNIDVEAFWDYLFPGVSFSGLTGQNSDVWKRIEYKQRINVNLFDGVGLIDKAFSETVNERYCKEKGQKEVIPYSSYQIRMPFMKGMVHSCPLSVFFQEKGITEIKDYAGNSHPVDKIKMILTLSQFKGEKWMTNSWKIQHTTYDFAIEEYNTLARQEALKIYWEKISAYQHCLYITGKNNPFANDVTTTNYQFLHTPNMTEESFNAIKAITEKKYQKLLTDPETQIRFLENKDELLNDSSSTEEANTSEESKDADEEEDTPETEFDDDAKLSREHISWLVHYNKKFLSFPCIKSIIADKLKEISNEYALGRLFIEGETRFLSGDLLALLYHAVGLKLPKEETLHMDGFYAPPRQNARYLFDTRMACAFQRNPHLTRNEDAMLRSYYPPKDHIRNRLFGHLNGIVMINPLSLVAERLGGADYDGDKVKIFKNREYNQCISKHYNRSATLSKIDYADCKYPPIMIPHVTAPKNSFTDDGKLLAIKNTFSSKTGQINNCAFLYSIDAYNENTDQKSSSDAQNAEFLSIMTGLEIDSAKSGKKPNVTAYLRQRSLQNFDQKKFFTYYKAHIKDFDKDSIPITYAYFSLNHNESVLINKKTSPKKANRKQEQIISSIRLSADSAANLSADARDFLDFARIFIDGDIVYRQNAKIDYNDDEKNKIIDALEKYSSKNKKNSSAILKELASACTFFQNVYKAYNRQLFLILPEKGIPNIDVLPYFSTRLSEIEWDEEEEDEEEDEGNDTPKKANRLTPADFFTCFNTFPDFSEQEFNKLLGIWMSYFSVISQLDMTQQRNKYQSSVNSVYEKQINLTLLCQGKEDKMDDLLYFFTNMGKTKLQQVSENFQKANPNDKNAIKKDFDRNKWMFLSKEEREKTLSDIIPDIQDDIKELLCDFSHEGYLLLYRCIKASEERFNNNPMPEELFKPAKSVDTANLFPSSLRGKKYRVTDVEEYDKTFQKYYDKYTQYGKKLCEKLISVYKIKENITKEMIQNCLDIVPSADKLFRYILNCMNSQKAYRLLWNDKVFTKYWKQYAQKGE